MLLIFVPALVTTEISNVKLNGHIRTGSVLSLFDLLQEKKLFELSSRFSQTRQLNIFSSLSIQRSKLDFSHKLGIFSKKKRKKKISSQNQNLQPHLYFF